MFTSITKKFGTIGLIAGGAVGIALTIGGLATGAVEIWRKDQSGVVRVFPTSLEINVNGSSVTTNTLTQGGGIRATSTVNNAETLLASDFDVENVIDYTLNVQAATLTLPASSTLSSFVPTAGQTRSIFIRNATTTATNLTIAGATGVLLKKATSTAVIIGDTDGANYARIDFTRKANTDIEALLHIFID